MSTEKSTTAVLGENELLKGVTFQAAASNDTTPPFVTPSGPAVPKRLIFSVPLEDIPTHQRRSLCSGAYRFQYRHKGRKPKGRRNYPPLPTPLPIEQVMSQALKRERRWIRKMQQIRALFNTDALMDWLDGKFGPKNRVSHREVKYNADLLDSSTWVGRAYDLAIKYHAGQVDRAGKPYTEHLIRVGRRGSCETTQAAGILHDIISDTELTMSALVELFPHEICLIVHDLTRQHTETRWENIMRIGKFEHSTEVKLNDLVDNMDLTRFGGDIDKMPPTLFEHYRKAHRFLRERQLENDWDVRAIKDFPLAPGIAFPDGFIAVSTPTPEQ